MRYGYIYEITNNINGKKYIGQHKGDGNDTYMGSGIHLKRAQEKYGIENFSKRILNFYDTRDELNDAEKYFIAVYRLLYGCDMMYNIADGGDGGNLGEEVNKKRAEVNKGKFAGEKNPMYGKHHSEETKKKQSVAKTGEKHPKSRKVNQYDLNGNFIRAWNCINDVKRELGIAQSHISECCRGKRNKAGKFIWRYV